MKERLDRRVLGAVRWVDHLTGRAVPRNLTVRSAQAQFRSNASHLALIVGASGFDDYTAAFADPLPAAGPLTITATVEDPLGDYLPRTFSVALPRSVVVSAPLPANSVFRPVDVELLPGATGRSAPGWAEARVNVKRLADNSAFPSVLVRARGDLADGQGARVLGVGMSDARGEALVFLPEIPLLQPDPVSGKMAPTKVDLTFEFVPPPAGQTVVDWTPLLPAAAQPANVLGGQTLGASRRLSFEFQVTV